MDLPCVFKLLLILKPKAVVPLQAEKEILAACLLSKDEHYHHDSCHFQSGRREMQIW